MPNAVGWHTGSHNKFQINAGKEINSNTLTMRAEEALRLNRPFVILDDQSSDCAIWFENLQHVLIAWDLSEVDHVIAAAQQAANGGYEVAGFLSYRAGQAFDTLGSCSRQLSPDLALPLAWFGVFSSAESGRIFLDRPAGDCAFTMEAATSDIEYQDNVKAVIAHIEAGSAYQVNVTFPSFVKISDLFGYYERIRQQSKASFGAIVSTGAHQILSFSPEMFFRLSGNAIEARPMKGTRARGACPVSDSQAASELANSTKDRAENLMIVDLLRNDLSRICRPGSVQVPELFSIEQYPTLWQMTSTVTGEMQAGRDISDVLRSLFPCGSIVGAPKIIASEIIESIEKFDRGLYTGSIGWIRKDSAVFNVAIRTMQLTRHGDVYAGRLDVGAGIVADSEPRSEWEECITKASFSWPH